MLSSIFNRRYKESQLELISIHIPKSAGTSFRRTLEKVYGKRNVLRIDIVGKQNRRIRFDDKLVTNPSIPNHIRVIHGHFNYEQLLEHFEISSDIPIITWLRRPESRVISDYFYLEKQLKSNTNERGERILRRMQRSLMEYARLEKFQNLMTRYMRGMKLEDFFFIGIVENYSDDLKILAQKLNWRIDPEYNVNKSGNYKDRVSEEHREAIRQMNIQDVQLYESVVNLRKN